MSDSCRKHRRVMARRMMCVLLLVAHCRGGVFVSPHGHDGATGTQKAPVRTLQRAQEVTQQYVALY